MQKTIDVLFRIPEEWVDLESPLGILGHTLKQEVRKSLRDALTDQYVSKQELPKLEITKEELKKEVLSRMADKAIERMDDDY